MSILKIFQSGSRRADWKTRKKYLKFVWKMRRSQNLPQTVWVLLGLRMPPHQRISIRLAWTHSRCLWLFSRGGAKTFSEALLHILCCMLYRSYRVQTVAGGSFKQTKQTLNYEESIVNNEIPSQKTRRFAQKMLPTPKKVILKTSNSEWDVKLGTSQIKGLAINGDNRGFRGFLLTVGEANDVDRETLDAVFKPFIAVKYDPMGRRREVRYFKIFPHEKINTRDQNMILYSGTLNYDWTPYWHTIEDYLRKVEEGQPEYAIAIFDFEDTYIGEQNYVNPVITKAYYEMDLKSILASLNDDIGIDIDSWKAEYKNVVIRIKGKEFPPDLIFNSFKDRDGIDTRAIMKPRSDKVCLMGIDPGITAEFSITVIEISEDFFTVVYVYGQKGMTYREMTEKVLDCLNRFPNTILVCMDQGGGGTAIRDNLRDKAFTKVPIIDPSDPANARIIDSSEHKGILRMLVPSAERNTVWNKMLQNMLERHKLVMPYTSDGRFIMDEDTLPKEYFNGEEVRSEIIGLYNDLRIQKKQVILIRTERAGNYLSYFIKGNKTKDRYSSLVYAGGAALQTYLIEELGSGTPAEEEEPFGIWR